MRSLDLKKSAGEAQLRAQNTMLRGILANVTETLLKTMGLLGIAPLGVGDDGQGEEAKETPEYDRLERNVDKMAALARVGALVYTPPAESDTPKAESTRALEEFKRPAAQFLTYPNGGSLAKTVICVEEGANGAIRQIQTLIDMTYWYSCQMEPTVIF